MTPDCAPETIIIHFPNYTGPQFFLDENKKNWIPINPLVHRADNFQYV